MFGLPHESLSMLHATLRRLPRFRQTLGLPSALKMEYLLSSEKMIFLHRWWRQFWRCIVHCRRSWRWRIVRRGPLVRRRHLMLLAINRRRTVSSLISLWWLPIGCRVTCLSLVNRLFIGSPRMYLSWRGAVTLGWPLRARRLDGE